MRKFFRSIWWVITAPFRFVIWIFKWIGRWIGDIASNIHQLFTEEPDDRPLTETFGMALDTPQEFWTGVLSHLDDLRKHLLRAVLVLVLMVTIVAFFMQDLLVWISEPIGGIEALQSIEVTESLGVVMRIVLLGGFALAMPYIIFELYLFIAPGLKRRARVIGLITIPVAFLFFLGGMAFAYYVMMPAALPFLINFMGIKTVPRPASYVKFVTGLMFWVGIAFEFPLIIFGMAGMGIVRAEDLIKYWRIAIIIIAVVAAVITPTIDPINMALVMGPMIVLYFLSILLAKIAQGKREKQIVNSE
jgi:sec-independent protein translocase protein TatC